MADRLRRSGRSAALLLLVTLAAACGDDGGGGKDAQSTITTTPGGGANTDITVAPNVELQTGGRVVYGLGGETDGWNPTTNRWAPPGLQVASTIFDSLAAYDAEGIAQPYLAESIEPNDDHSVWTITLREGVTFHNGEPLTAVHIKTLLDAHMKSILTSVIFAPVRSVEVTDDRTVTVTMLSPWAHFTDALTGQPGFVVHPSVLTNRDPAVLPIGTGPFTCDEWQRDKNLLARRYDKYWRTDDEGRQLPYLDEIEYQPITDEAQRVQALQSGDIDLGHTAVAQYIKRLRELTGDGDFQLFLDDGEGEEVAVMLNTMQAPLDDLRVRKALALATDRERYRSQVAENEFPIADGPISPESPFYSPSGYPDFDLDAAKALIEEVEADGGPLEITLGAPPENVNAAQLVQSMWEDAGIDVEVETTELTSYVTNAVTGRFEALMWRQFAGPDPDVNFQWWHSSSAKPVGEIGLNMARNRDPEIDAALGYARLSTDVEGRKEAYGIVVTQLAKDLPYLWLTHATYAVGASNKVHGVENGPLPDGSPSLPFGAAAASGIHRVATLWVEH